MEEVVKLSRPERRRKEREEKKTFNGVVIYIPNRSEKFLDMSETPEEYATRLDIKRMVSRYKDKNDKWIPRTLLNVNIIEEDLVKLARKIEVLARKANRFYKSSDEFYLKKAKVAEKAIEDRIDFIEKLKKFLEKKTVPKK